MPIFSNQESLETVRTKVNAAIRLVETGGIGAPNVAAFIASNEVARGIGSIWIGGGFCYEETDASDYHIANAGGVRFYALPTASGEFTATQLGAPEGGDITAAVQKAVDVALGYYGAPQVKASVLIDVSTGTLSETIHLGYGDALKGIRIRGLGINYAFPGYGTRLTTTMVNRPAFAVTAARSTVISDLYLIGPATSAITSALGSPTITNVAEATYDTALTSAGITTGRRYAPHAAIAIDPYAGTKPGTAYPDVTPPASIASGFTQYGKAGSSAVVVDNVMIEGYEVGIAQTPADHDSNGDFLKLRNVVFRYVKFAVSYGQSQARALSITGCNFDFLFCALTNNKHGKQTGTMSGVAQSCGFAGNVAKVFDLVPPYFNGLAFRDCDMESIYRLGDLGTATGDVGSMSFDNCMIDFCHSGRDLVPPNVMETTGSAHVYFIGGEITGYPSVFSLKGVRAEFRGTRLKPSATFAKEYEWLAMNALAGGLSLDMTSFNSQEILFRPYDVSSGAEQNATLCGGLHNISTGRSYCVPIYAERASRQTGYLRRTVVPTPRPFLYNDDNAATAHSSVSRSARAFTFTTTGIGSDARFNEQMGYKPGDIIQDVTTGSVLFIRSVSAGVVIAELQNNYYWDGSAYQLVDTALTLTSGLVRTLCSRVYAAPEPIVGSVASGSPTITVTAAPSVSSSYGLATGDFLAVDALPVNTFTGSNALSVSAIDTGAGTITMAGNSSVTAASVAFDWWIRQAPANAGSR